MHEIFVRKNLASLSGRRPWKKKGWRGWSEAAVEKSLAPLKGMRQSAGGKIII
jgi:hypothetical protein